MVLNIFSYLNIFSSFTDEPLHVNRKDPQCSSNHSWFLYSNHSNSPGWLFIPTLRYPVTPPPSALPAHDCASYFPQKIEEIKGNLPTLWLILSSHPTWPITGPIWHWSIPFFLKHFLFGFWNIMFSSHLTGLLSQSSVLVPSHLSSSWNPPGNSPSTSLLSHLHSFGDFAQAHGFKHHLYANASQICILV